MSSPHIYIGHYKKEKGPVETTGSYYARRASAAAYAAEANFWNKKMNACMQRTEIAKKQMSRDSDGSLENRDVFSSAATPLLSPSPAELAVFI